MKENDDKTSDESLREAEVILSRFDRAFQQVADKYDLTLRVYNKWTPVRHLSKESDGIYRDLQLLCNTSSLGRANYVSELLEIGISADAIIEGMDKGYCERKTFKSIPYEYVDQEKWIEEMWKTVASLTPADFV